MAYPLDRWLYSNQDPVNGYPPRVASPESVVDSATLGGKSSAFSSSSGSRYGSATDSSSRKSSTSTTPSTAPSLHLPGHIPVAPPPPLATTAFVAENYLPCEFVYAGCEVFYNLRKSAFRSRTPFICLENTRCESYPQFPPIQRSCLQISKMHDWNVLTLKF